MKPIALLLALVTAAPAAAWEAGVDGHLCTLTHTEESAAVRLTYDPGVPLYTIAVSGTGPWPVGAPFSIAFEGNRPNVISTDRQVLSPDLGVLSVSDRGFGNVLDGLAFNTSAVAISGEVAVRFSLEGAAPEVAAFQACGQVPSV